MGGGTEDLGMRRSETPCLLLEEVGEGRGKCLSHCTRPVNPLLPGACWQGWGRGGGWGGGRRGCLAHRLGDVADDRMGDVSKLRARIVGSWAGVVVGRWVEAKGCVHMAQ